MWLFGIGQMLANNQRALDIYSMVTVGGVKSFTYSQQPKHGLISSTGTNNGNYLRLICLLLRHKHIAQVQNN